MILPDFRLDSRARLHWQFSGIDSLEHCLDKQHFQSYPHPIEYRYNIRGFRDAEWPKDIDQLKHAVWCVGDSFTVGIGSPLTHTWVNILQNKLNKRCINVSMDGASNEWMLRKIKNLVEIIAPRTIIVQWSYFARSELPDDSMPDERRKLWYTPQADIEREIENFKNCVLQVTQLCKNCNIIHSIIPYAVSAISVDEGRGWWLADKDSTWPQDLPDLVNDIPPWIIEQLQKREIYEKYARHYMLQNFIKENKIILVNQVDEFFNKDYARDGHHYDIKTATHFVNQLIELI
jgi:hypothetical protein